MQYQIPCGLEIGIALSAKAWLAAEPVYFAAMGY